MGFSVSRIRNYIFRHFLEKTVNRVIAELSEKKIQGLCIGDDCKLLLTHYENGGAQKYLNEKIERGEFSTDTLVVVKNYIPKGYYEVRIRIDGDWSRYILKNLASLSQLIRRLKLSEIFVNELFDYPNLGEMLELLTDVRADAECEMTYCLHDFYSICPGCMLLDKENVYCRLNKSCDNCHGRDFGGIEGWRNSWHSFIRNCTRVIAFSNSTKSLINEVYPDVAIEVIPHKAYETLREVNCNAKSIVTSAVEERNESSVINVAVLGVLSVAKGYEVVKGIVDKLSDSRCGIHGSQTRRYDIRLVHMGNMYCEPIPDSDYFYSYGPYDRGKLPDIMENENISAVLIPSICPETFSYTCQEARMMKLPVICFDIGAQAEYTRAYEKGCVIPKINADCAIETIVSCIDRINR